jgi:hypothetical protein
MKATLIGAFGRIDLGPARLTIVRAPNNQIVLDDPLVSGYHAEILPEGKGYSIIDLESTNGTFVNDYRLAPHFPHPLNPNDKLRFGRNMDNPATTFTYEVMGIAPVERTYAVQSSSPAHFSSPQQGYQPQPPPSKPTYPPPQQDDNKKGDDKEGKWSWRDWIVKVIIPVLGILATAGFFTAKAFIPNTPSIQPTPNIQPTPSIPQLHQTYSGHLTAVSGTGPLFLTGVSEDSSGNFTATGTDGSCPATIDNGKVSANNTITFELKETVTGLCGFTGEFKGTIRSDGSMSGTWNVPNTQGQGAWDLS